jgi:hypothetical protein
MRRLTVFNFVLLYGPCPFKGAVRVKKSRLSLSCDLEGLDSGTTPVISKVMALVKRAPPGVKNL